MTFRSWAAAALCLGALVGWRSPAAGPQHYKIEIKTKVVQDFTAMGQSEQTQDLSNTAFVSVTERDSAARRLVHITVDSLLAGPGSLITPEQLKTVVGSTWHGTRGPNGRLDSLSLEGDNAVAATLGGLLKLLFPPLRKGAVAGQSWTDTTDSEGLMGVPVRTVTNLVTAADTWQGAKVMKLTGASATAISGTIQAPQGQVSIEGKGTGNISWLIANDGTLISSIASNNQSMMVTIAVAPAPIPVTLEVNTTTTLLK